MANVVANVANLMSEGTAPRMGRPVIDAKASIISKLFVVPRLQQDGAEPSLKQEVTAAETWFHGELQWPRQRRWQPSTPEEEDPKEAAEAESIRSDVQKLGPIRSNNYIWWRGERNTVMYHQRRSYQDREEEGMYNRFSCFAVHSKMSQSTNAKSKPMEEGCILTLT